jgi:regulator of sigma E protease
MSKFSKILWTLVCIFILYNDYQYALVHRSGALEVLGSYLAISFIIVLHKLGILLFSRFFTVPIDSFTLGFGPKLIEKKVGQTMFACSAIPLGAFVVFAEEKQEHSNTKNGRPLQARPYWQKLIILTGGALFNITFAYLALVAVLMAGMPCFEKDLCQDMEPTIGTIIPWGAAAKTTLQPGDTIVDVNGIPTTTVKQVSSALKKTPYTDMLARKSVVTVIRDGSHIRIPIVIPWHDTPSNPRHEPFLGIQWQSEQLTLSQSLIAALRTAQRLLGSISITSIHGPFWFKEVIFDIFRTGFRTFLLFLAYMSALFALFNVLPLAGSRGENILLYTIEAIMGRPLADQTRHSISDIIFYATVAIIASLSIIDAIPGLIGLSSSSILTATTG